MSDVFSMAERNVIGWLLIDPVRILPRVRPIVSPGDFLQDDARALFTAACELEDFGKPLDVVTIQKRAAENGSEVSAAWIKAAMAEAPQNSDVQESARIVHDEAVDRTAAGIGNELLYRRISPEEAVEQLQNTVAGRRATLPTPVDSMREFYKSLFEADKPPGLPIGYPSVDAMLGGGLVAQGLITLAARTSVGKTSVGINITLNVARAGGRVLYFSLEMSKEQINTRFLAAETGMSTTYITNRLFRNNDDECRTILRGVSSLSKLPIFVCDENCTLSDIERHVRTELPLDLVIVDHGGIITPDSKQESSYYTATMRSHRLKQLAKSTGVPILMLYQLNRQVEQRDEKRPRLSDLRDSGSIEEDSDAVLLLYRDGYYQRPQPGPWEVQPIEIEVAKNRHGQTGTVTLDFVGACCRVTDPTAQMVDTDEEVPFDG